MTDHDGSSAATQAGIDLGAACEASVQNGKNHHVAALVWHATPALRLAAVLLWQAA